MTRALQQLQNEKLSENHTEHGRNQETPFKVHIESDLSVSSSERGNVMSNKVVNDDIQRIVQESLALEGLNCILYHMI